MAKLHILMAVSALLGNHLLMGQVNLVIEDETEQGFFLGINGYLQNIEKSQQIRTTSLDTVPYVVLIDTDTTQIAKRIHLREPGTYRYVLTRNFYNEVKLRYRGEVDANTAKALGQDYDQSVRWPDEWQNLIAAAKKTTPPQNAPQRSTPVDTTGPIKDDTSSVAILASAKTASDEEDSETAALLPGSDTIAEPPTAPIVKEPETPPFEQLLAQLRAEAYEFEKLTASLAYAKEHPLKVAELKQLFRLLSYDQTRLQLLQNISNSIKNPDRLAELEEELEYEISKKKLQKIISP